MQRTIFFISDGTAITAETLGHSLLTQFSGVDFKQLRIPFVDSTEKAHMVLEQINTATQADGAPAIVFNTIVDESLCTIIRSANAQILDLFSTFMGTLEQALGMKRSPTVGLAHGVGNLENYENRIEATNYTLNHDDGIDLQFDDADVILVGVSRSGKTPTCLYMALHFGVKAANYPLTEEDLEQMRLPAFLRQQRKKIVGLTIEPERLVQIRETRKPGSRYASHRQCQWEVEIAESLLRLEGVPIMHTTHASIEEIASRIMLELGIQKEMY